MDVIKRGMSNTENLAKAAKETHRMALYMWFGLLLAMTLFFVQGQLVFITEEPRPSSKMEWMLVGLGLITFYFWSALFSQLYRCAKKRNLVGESQRSQAISLDRLCFSVSYV